MAKDSRNKKAVHSGPHLMRHAKKNLGAVCQVRFAPPQKSSMARRMDTNTPGKRRGHRGKHNKEVFATLNGRLERGGGGGGSEGDL